MRQRKSSRLAGASLGPLLAIGCAAGSVAGDGDRDPHHGDGLVEVGTDVCASGRKWQGGDQESALMHPGRSCISCHRAEDEGPELVAAGTVYATLHEADDCAGVEGVTVLLTGSDGRVFTLLTNEAGNFLLGGEDDDFAFDGGEGGASLPALKLPYRARVVAPSGAHLEMASAQTSGDCPTCHTAAGANGAPGRIVIP